MIVPKYVLIFAGVLVFMTSLLAFLHSRNWLLLTMFVGLNLTQYAITSVCPLIVIVNKLRGKSDSSGGCCCHGE